MLKSITPCNTNIAKIIIYNNISAFYIKTIGDKLPIFHLQRYYFFLLKKKKK